MEDPAAEPLSIAEIGERFDGEWVLIRITGYDDRRMPARGQLIAHGRSNRAVCGMIDRALADPVPPDQPYYLFSAFKPLPPGTDLRTVWSEPLQEGDVHDEQPVGRRR
jgi:hypothetical protein